jgi:hypothetical protein
MEIYVVSALPFSHNAENSGFGDLITFFPLSAFVNGGNERQLSDVKNPRIAKIM